MSDHEGELHMPHRIAHILTLRTGSIRNLAVGIIAYSPRPKTSPPDGVRQTGSMAGMVAVKVFCGEGGPEIGDSAGRVDGSEQRIKPKSRRFNPKTKTMNVDRVRTMDAIGSRG